MGGCKEFTWFGLCGNRKMYFTDGDPSFVLITDKVTQGDT